MRTFVSTFAPALAIKHMGYYPKDMQHFFLAGINYKKSDSATRSRFAISSEQYAQIIKTGKENGIAELFVLSTCNRTEIYGIARDADQLVQLICAATGEPEELFYSIAYQHRGKAAVQHFFEVAAGLDSQILGDYEIVGQIKLAMKFSKDLAGVGPFIERLYNQVLQASKLIKNHTALSSGTVSVSFAAIQYIKENVPQAASKNILLIGTGKIGRNTCKNLLDYIGCQHITLVNRTFEKALKLATVMNLQALPIAQINAAIAAADIIIVAANADEPIIRTAVLPYQKTQWIIDLSIPNNVHPEVATTPGKQLLNVDQLSRLKDATLQKRLQEVPKAMAIIEEQTADFLQWCAMRKQLAVLGVVKTKLEEINTSTTFTAPEDTATRIQQVLNSMAAKMRIKNQSGCHYLEAINDFIAFGAN
jgi:glutamyl-tRNA reductase